MPGPTGFAIWATGGGFCLVTLGVIALTDKLRPKRSDHADARRLARIARLFWQAGFRAGFYQRVSPEHARTHQSEAFRSGFKAGESIRRGEEVELQVPGSWVATALSSIGKQPVVLEGDSEETDEVFYPCDRPDCPVCTERRAEDNV